MFLESGVKILKFSVCGKLTKKYILLFECFHLVSNRTRRLYNSVPLVHCYQCYKYLLEPDFWLVKNSRSTQKSNSNITFSDGQRLKIFRYYLFRPFSKYLIKWICFCTIFYLSYPNHLFAQAAVLKTVLVVLISMVCLWFKGWKFCSEEWLSRKLKNPSLHHLSAVFHCVSLGSLFYHCMAFTVRQEDYLYPTIFLLHIGVLLFF